nr:immunoglobulin heavy chain junction region [Mus musculus]
CARSAAQATGFDYW